MTEKKKAEPEYTLVPLETDEQRARVFEIVDEYYQGLKSPVQLPVEWLVDSLKAHYPLPREDYGVSVSVVSG